MLDLDEKNFAKEVLRSKKLVLVDFWAPWCGACQMISPIIEEIAKRFENKMEFAKVNVDENSALVQKYKISAIPTLFIFKKGKIVEEMIGLESKEQLTVKINSLIK